jgi:hypothetical protein
MACLSILRQNGSMVICASPVFFTSELDYCVGSRITFEVQEIDAAMLKDLIGQPRTYLMGAGGSAVDATLVHLAPCTPTVASLASLRKLVLSGAFSVIGEHEFEKPPEA